MPAPACGHCGYNADGLRGPTCPECGAPWAEEAARPSEGVRLLLAGALVAAALIAAPIVWGAIDSSEWWTPRSMLIVAPGFIAESSMACFLAAGLLAGLHAIPILRGRTRMSVHLAVPVAALLLFEWLWLLAGVPHGQRYQGGQYVTTCFVGQAIVTAALAAIWFSSRGKHSFARCAMFTIVSGLWVTTYAFPWLGETL